MAHAHLLFEIHDIVKKSHRLLRAQARDIQKKPLDRLAFVGKQKFPLMKLLIDERKKCQRQAIENTLIQCFLERCRGILPAAAIPFHPRTAGSPRIRRSYARISFSLPPCDSIGLQSSKPASVGHTSTWRMGRSTICGLSMPAPIAIIHVSRVESSLAR